MRAASVYVPVLLPPIEQSVLIVILTAPEAVSTVFDNTGPAIHAKLAM